MKKKPDSMTALKQAFAKATRNVDRDAKSLDRLVAKIPRTQPDLPVNWDSCTETQLRWLVEHGSYGQRLIAKRLFDGKDGGK